MVNEANISILNHDDCCGCKACGSVCPVKCISYFKDEEGFFYPSVNEELCISCGKCKKACPEINQFYNQKAKVCHAAFANEAPKRIAGSSGGVFGLLAAEVIEEGGKVWGAAFDDSLKLRHVCAVDIEGIKPILKSKYLQSDTNDVYSLVSEDVKSGIRTLFSGTPCQCNAIRNIVGENDILITVEVVCHGVPSQDLFDKSIKWLENKEHCKVTNFIFRSKHAGARHPHAFTYVKACNGKSLEINGLHYQFPFYFGFQKYMTLRPSCYSCKWAKPERTADITLGDFWGIEKYDTSLDAKTGISQVIVNTKRGASLFEMILKKNEIWSESFPIQYAIDNNACLKSPTKLSSQRKDFFEALRTEDFNSVVKKFLVPKRKWIFDMYYGMPGVMRRLVRKGMDKRMKYE